MKTALTIGFFDGVHLGHQALLKTLRSLSPHTTILTFPNHPRTVLHPPAPAPIIPLSQKIALLKKYADELLIVDFTLEFAATPYDALLGQFDLSHLVLGRGSVFGKSREGNETNVRNYAAQKGFAVEYIDKVMLDGEPISSSRIRKALASDPPLATRLLGHQ